MLLSAIALRLREGRLKTDLGFMITGATTMGAVRNATFDKEAAFVIPLAEAATRNETDMTAIQRVTERFAVIVALRNDKDMQDELGITAYDRLHTARAYIFNSILGWDMNAVLAGTVEVVSVISFRGGRLIDLNRANLWYQFEFEYDIQLSDDDCTTEDQDALGEFTKLYTEYVTSPSTQLPYGGTLPTPDSIDKDMSTFVELNSGNVGGPFTSGFGTGFKFWEIGD